MPKDIWRNIYQHINALREKEHAAQHECGLKDKRAAFECDACGERVCKHHKKECESCAAVVCRWHLADCSVCHGDMCYSCSVECEVCGARACDVCKDDYRRLDMDMWYCEMCYDPDDEAGEL